MPSSGRLLDEHEVRMPLHLTPTTGHLDGHDGSGWASELVATILDGEHGHVVAERNPRSSE